MASLPDDIEQRILDGRWACAVQALVTRRNISLEEARTAIGDWLREHAHGAGQTAGCQPSEFKYFRSVITIRRYPRPRS
jgi:hypothetical protein